jgi:lysophospholipid hydrolase
VFNLGEPSHSIFIVLTGRLRSITERTSSRSGAESSLEIEGEYGQSESVGELEVLVDTPRSSTVHVMPL